MGVQTPWLKRDEAAEYCRVEPTTIDRWAKKGWIPKHKIGKIQSVRYHRDELDSFMAGQPDVQGTVQTGVDADGIPYRRTVPTAQSGHADTSTVYTAYDETLDMPEGVPPGIRKVIYREYP